MGDASYPAQAQRMTASSWEPCWLGDPARSLYAGLHLPSGACARTGVVLASPLLHEQPRTRRFMLELASGLVATGLACLRFDFFGSGDSAGQSEQMDFASMCADLRTADAELRARTGVERVNLLAMRGSSLAAFAWLRAGAHPERLILWEPILDGPAWLHELQTEDAAERCSARRYPLVRGRRAVAADNQLMGYPVSQRFREDIAGAGLPNAATPAGTPVWAVLRQDAQALPIDPEQTFTLPADAPVLGGATRMDAAVFVSPGVRSVVEKLGFALQWAG